MSGFILLTDKDTNSKILFAIDKILSFSADDDGSTFVAVGMNDNDEPIGFNAIESFDKIACLLSDSGLAIC